MSAMFTDLKIPAGRRPLTRSEARTSAVLVTVFTLMIVVAVFEEYSPKKLSVLFFVAFWVPMLIVHELGHAVAAKMLGWQVREIVIGFGRDLWSFRVGATRVRIKLAPVEGYVLPAPVEPDNVRLKSTLVYAAGPGAELVVLAGMIAWFGWSTVFNDSNDVGLIALKSLAIVIIYGAGFNLLPFRTEGAVSDGLGILSSPFMARDAIEIRLLTFELREIQERIDRGETRPAVDAAATVLARYPDNTYLKLLYGSALSADRQDQPAREFVRDQLAADGLADDARREWLHLQALIELNAGEPAYLTLDLALQKALQITPNSPELIATRGASLVRRGRWEEGGNMLADAWRRNRGSADDALILAYLTVAAHRSGNRDAFDHFSTSFALTNKSRPLERRLERLLGVEQPE